jgi:hypothetical protein
MAGAFLSRFLRRETVNVKRAGGDASGTGMALDWLWWDGAFAEVTLRDVDAG